MPVRRVAVPKRGGRMLSLRDVSMAARVTARAQRARQTYERSRSAVEATSLIGVQHTSYAGQPATLDEKQPAEGRPPPILPPSTWPRSLGELLAKKAQEDLEKTMSYARAETPDNGIRKPWYKHISALKGPLGMQQVSPTPGRKRVGSEQRGDTVGWSWLTKQQEVFPGSGFREANSREQQAHVPPAPKPLWQQDMDARFHAGYNGRRVEKAASGITVAKPARGFPGSKDEMHAVIPGVPAFIQAKWRTERAEVMRSLDQHNGKISVPVIDTSDECVAEMLNNDFKSPLKKASPSISRLMKWCTRAKAKGRPEIVNPAAAAPAPDHAELLRPRQNGKLTNPGAGLQKSSVWLRSCG